MNPAPRHRPREYNWFNQLVAVAEGSGGTTSFGYDGNGNQVSKSDGLGTTTYGYNYDNRLVGISGPTGSSYFEYDANGLRTKKADASGTRSYLLDGLSVVAEYAPDASKLTWYTQSLARIDEVLSVVNSTGKYWYETDALGSTYALANSTGAVVSRSSYDVFGERALAAGSDLGQPFGFTGREHDLGGLVYARDRYLSPAAGRWTQADRLGFDAGPNAFEYVRGQPTRLVDPSGQLPFLMLPLFGAAIGGIFGLLGGLAQGGLSKAQLVQEFISGAMFGAAATIDVVGKIVPWVKTPIITGAITNALFAAIGNVAAQVIATGSVQSWPSVIISALFAAGATMLMGMNRFGLRDAARRISSDVQLPFTARDMFTLIPAKGGAMFDFMVQSMLVPAFYYQEQSAQIDAMFREGDLACLPG